MMAHNKPRRAGARWREGAPAYVLGCFDYGSHEVADRYTVFLEPETHGQYGWWVPYLSLCENPEKPWGVSGYAEMTQFQFSAYRYRGGRLEGNRRIRWLGLPENVRAHIRCRMEG